MGQAKYCGIARGPYTIDLEDTQPVRPAGDYVDGAEERIYYCQWADRPVVLDIVVGRTDCVSGEC